MERHGMESFRYVYELYMGIQRSTDVQYLFTYKMIQFLKLQTTLPGRGSWLRPDS